MSCLQRQANAKSAKGSKLTVFKALADVCEAIMGAAYKSGGPELGLRTCKSLGLAIPLIDKWEDFSSLYKPIPVDPKNELSLETLSRLEDIIKYRPSKQQYLSQAFV